MIEARGFRGPKGPNVQREMQRPKKNGAESPVVTGVLDLDGVLAASNPSAITTPSCEHIRVGPSGCQPPVFTGFSRPRPLPGHKSHRRIDPAGFGGEYPSEVQRKVQRLGVFS